MKKRVLIFIIVLGMTRFMFGEPILKSIGNYYIPKEGAKSQNIFFPYYATEAGMMFGHFYYNTDTFDKETYFTNIFLYTPVDNIGVDWMTLENYPLTDNWSFGSSFIIAKFAEIRNYTFGNYGSDEERDYSKGIDEKSGYDFGEGTQYKGDVSLTRKLGNNQEIKFSLLYLQTDNSMKKAEEFVRETGVEMPTEVNDRTDKIGIEWLKDSRKNSIRPMDGRRIVFGVEKSLNLISHNSKNDWDYYKAKFDYSEHFAIGEKSNLSLRFYSVNFEYLVEPKEGVIDSTDMPTLGDLDTFRGFYYSRFRDKNLALWQGEYRFPLNKKNNVRLGLFGEVGRVSKKYDLEMFYKDLKWDAGVGMKYFFNDDVMIRADLAFSEEATQVRFATTQAF